MHIRFFHALFSLTESVILSVEGGHHSKPLSFGELSDYLPASAGFLRITVIGSRSRTVYLQKTLPFFSPDAFTLAVIPGFMGMDLLQIPDYPCFSSRPEFGCIRTVSLTCDPFCYFLYLYGNRLLFSDVTFRNVTCQKQLKGGQTGIYLTLPGSRTPVIPSVFPLKGKESCTCYVFGSLSDGSLSLFTAKDTPAKL